MYKGNGFLDGLFLVKFDGRCFGFFIRSGNARHVFDFPFSGLFIEALNIATFAFFQTCIYEHLYIIVLAYDSFYKLSIFFIGRNKGRKNHDTGIYEQFSDFTDSPDIFRSILFTKAKISINALSHIIAVQHIGFYVLII